MIPENIQLLISIKENLNLENNISMLSINPHPNLYKENIRKDGKKTMKDQIR